MALENPKADAVVRGYLLISGLYTLSASLIWGVNTLFLLDAGLDLLGVFVANAVFTGSMALFEIPTGVVADTRGRRLSFLLSVAILVLGTGGYLGVAAAGGSLAGFCVMSVVLGIGYTFYSGAVEAWLVDALRASGYDGGLDRVFARGSMVSGAAMLIGTLGGGLLGSWHLYAPFLVRTVLLLVLFFVALRAMHDIGFTARPFRLAMAGTEMLGIAKASVQFGWRDWSVRLLIAAGLVPAVFMDWGYHAWQPYLLGLLGEDLVWVAGAIAAAISLSIIAGNAVVEWLTRFCGKRTTLLLWAAAVQAVAIVGVGFAGSFWVALPLYLLAMASTGVFRPVRQAYLHQRIPSEQRATVVSFDSLVSSGGSMVGQAGLGAVAQGSSLASGYLTGGFICLLGLPLLSMLRRRHDRADVIVGRAGKLVPQAGQGLPEVVAVDSSAHTEEG